jgi:hypothetical protein
MRRRKISIMAGVWVMKDGVMRLAEGDEAARLLKEADARRQKEAEARRLLEKQSPMPKGVKRLLHIPSGKVVLSSSELEEMLVEQGWQRYDDSDNTALLQFNKPGNVLGPISVPRDFADLTSDHIREVARRTGGTTFGVVKA